MSENPNAAAAAVRAMIAAGQEEALLRALAMPGNADPVTAPSVRGDVVVRLSDPWNAIGTYGLFREASREIVALRQELWLSAGALVEAARELSLADRHAAAQRCRDAAKRALVEAGDAARAAEGGDPAA
jgi:hypothetical protein